MRNFPWLMASIVGATVLPAIAFADLTRTGDASVAFVAVGPAGLKIEGKTTQLDVSEGGGKVRISVPLANLDTGIGLRNKHMREKYLEVAKFPRAELFVERSALNLPAPATQGAEVRGSAPASMLIHGHAKSITVRYTARRTADGYAVVGSTRVNMRDFGIDVPSYLGATVKPDVDIDVRFTAAGQ